MKDYLAELVFACPDPVQGRNVAREYLQARILAAMQPVDPGQPATLEAASREIRALFESATIPPQIATAIVQAYNQLPGIDPAVAVRSSATAEDLPEASFAGQQDTYLNILGGGALLEAVPEFHPYGKMVPKAALAIMVCGDLAREKYPGFWVQDCAAATQNLLLAAHGLGLGAVWTGLHPDQARVDGCRKLCNLPTHIVPLALVPVGYPDEEKPGAERFDPAKVHRDRW